MVRALSDITYDAHVTRITHTMPNSPAPLLEPREQWKTLCLSILHQIDAVDRRVPWTENEPKWWLDMMRVHHEAHAVLGGLAKADALATADVMLVDKLS